MSSTIVQYGRNRYACECGKTFKTGRTKNLNADGKPVCPACSSDGDRQPEKLKLNKISRLALVAKIGNKPTILATGLMAIKYPKDRYDFKHKFVLLSKRDARKISQIPDKP